VRTGTSSETSNERSFSAFFSVPASFPFVSLTVDVTSPEQ
jgi:hypothetical protein